MKHALSTVWKAHYYTSYAAAAASCGSLMLLTCLIFVLSPFLNEKEESWWKQWWIKAAITFAIAAPYYIGTERANQFLGDRNILIEEDPELEALTEKVLAVDYAMMKQCKNCLNYHGQTYNGNQLICAMHPYGQRNCSDYRANLNSLLRIANKTTPILEQVSVDLDPATKVLLKIRSTDPNHPQSTQIDQWIIGTEFLEQAISYFEKANRYTR